eukprot:Trichotokara_eunicae@DN165_c0_g1_i1.p1
MHEKMSAVMVASRLSFTCRLLSSSGVSLAKLWTSVNVHLDEALLKVTENRSKTSPPNNMITVKLDASFLEGPFTSEDNGRYLGVTVGSFVIRWPGEAENSWAVLHFGFDADADAESWFKKCRERIRKAMRRVKKSIFFDEKNLHLGGRPHPHCLRLLAARNFEAFTHNPGCSKTTPNYLRELLELPLEYWKLTKTDSVGVRFLELDEEKFKKNEKKKKKKKKKKVLCVDT